MLGRWGSQNNHIGVNVIGQLENMILANRSERAFQSIFRQVKFSHYFCSEIPWRQLPSLWHLVQSKHSPGRKRQNRYSQG